MKCEEIGKWYIWSDIHWDSFESIKIQNYAEQTIEIIKNEADLIDHQPEKTEKLKWLN